MWNQGGESPRLTLACSSNQHCAKVQSHNEIINQSILSHIEQVWTVLFNLIYRDPTFLHEQHLTTTERKTFIQRRSWPAGEVWVSTSGSICRRRNLLLYLLRLPHTDQTVNGQLVCEGCCWQTGQTMKLQLLGAAGPKNIFPALNHEKRSVCKTVETFPLRNDSESDPFGLIMLGKSRKAAPFNFFILHWS